MLRLRPNLEPVSLAPGWTVHYAGAQEKYLYFITSGIVSKFNLTRSGTSTGFAIIGSEGALGIASFLGGQSTLSEAVVLSAGHAYRLPAAVVKSEFKRRGALLDLLLRYTQAMLAETAQVALCNRHHFVERQLCRWILSCLDRLPSTDLAMTQEMIGLMLGVRREGITNAVGRLQDAGVIHCCRGHIAVLDRPRLEAQACECYAVIKKEYARLIPSICEPESLLEGAAAVSA